MYQASVPVFRHYLSRISDIVAVAGPDALDAQIADAFPARQQFAALGDELRSRSGGRRSLESECVHGRSPYALAF